jgi:CcmD family protein
MEKMTYLFLAYSAIWTGIFIFLLQIARRLAVMQKTVDALKQEIKSR